MEGRLKFGDSSDPSGIREGWLKFKNTSDPREVGKAAKV